MAKLSIVNNVTSSKQTPPLCPLSLCQVFHQRSVQESLFQVFFCPSVSILLALEIYYPSQNTAILQINSRMQVIKSLLYVAVKLLDALDKTNHKTVFLLLEFLATFYHVFLSNLWKNTAVNGTSRFKSTAPDKCINFFKKMQNSSRVYFSHNLLEIW